MTTPTPLKNQDSLKAFAAFALGIVVVLLLYAMLVTSRIATWQDRGLFGDMFGAANALFSGLAFTALVYALILQRRELALQRTELALTRAELSKQSEAQSLQAQTSLRAARISALGALLQTYAQLLSSSHSYLIHSSNYPVEIKRVKDELNALLEHRDA